MHKAFRRTALFAVMGGALALSACASTSDVEKAQQTADQAMSTAQQAQSTAQQAQSTAQQADQKADQALSEIQQMQQAPPKGHMGPRG